MRCKGSALWGTGEAPGQGTGPGGRWPQAGWTPSSGKDSFICDCFCRTMRKLRPREAVPPSQCGADHRSCCASCSVTDSSRHMTGFVLSPRGRQALLREAWSQMGSGDCQDVRHSDKATAARDQMDGRSPRAPSSQGQRAPPCPRHATGAQRGPGPRNGFPFPAAPLCGPLGSGLNWSSVQTLASEYG